MHFPGPRGRLPGFGQLAWYGHTLWSVMCFFLLARDLVIHHNQSERLEVWHKRIAAKVAKRYSPVKLAVSHIHVWHDTTKNWFLHIGTWHNRVSPLEIADARMGMLGTHQALYRGYHVYPKVLQHQLILQAAQTHHQPGRCPPPQRPKGLIPHHRFWAAHGSTTGRCWIVRFGCLPSCALKP